MFFGRSDWTRTSEARPGRNGANARKHGIACIRSRFAGSGCAKRAHRAFFACLPLVRMVRDRQEAAGSESSIANKKATGRQMPPRCFFGRSDWTRTSGLLVPNQAHYQAVPHPVVFCFDSIAYFVRFVKPFFCVFSFSKPKNHNHRISPVVMIIPLRK